MTIDRKFSWKLGQGRQLDLGERGYLMAIVNVTPDSFSDGGRYHHVDAAVAHGLACLAEGATILDIGGESTRPGAEPIDAGEEQRRILPVIEALASSTDALISVDTYRAETAIAALKAGAHIVNDVWGLQRDPEMANLIARAGAGVCIMHTGRGRKRLADPIADQVMFFEHSLAVAEKAGIERSSIMLDPGFGFAKETPADNWSLMARLNELETFGLPLLVGASRKRFLGALTGRDAAERDAATAATTVLMRMAGASVFRVHNVAMNRDALLVADAMLSARRGAYHTLSKGDA